MDEILTKAESIVLKLEFKNFNVLAEIMQEGPVWVTQIHFEDPVCLEAGELVEMWEAEQFADALINAQEGVIELANARINYDPKDWQ